MGLMNLPETQVTNVANVRSVKHFYIYQYVLKLGYRNNFSVNYNTSYVSDSQTCCVGESDGWNNVKLLHLKGTVAHDFTVTCLDK